MFAEIGFDDQTHLKPILRGTLQADYPPGCRRFEHQRHLYTPPRPIDRVRAKSIEIHRLGCVAINLIIPTSVRLRLVAGPGKRK